MFLVRASGKYTKNGSTHSCCCIILDIILGLAMVLFSRLYVGRDEDQNPEVLDMFYIYYKYT